MNFILQINVGVVKLTGATGTGKTTLLQELVRATTEAYQDIVVFYTTPSSFEEIKNTIRAQLGLDPTINFHDALLNNLQAKPNAQRRLIVVFDNAEQMDEQTLLGVGHLRSIQHEGHHLIGIVLCGTPALHRILKNPEHRLLTKDILLSYELSPLSSQQLPDFCRACLTARGLDSFVLVSDDYVQIMQKSGGLPGKVAELVETYWPEDEEITDQNENMPVFQLPVMESSELMAGVLQQEVAAAEASDVASDTPPVISQIEPQIEPQIGTQIVSQAVPVVAPPVPMTRVRKIAGGLLAAGVIIVITLISMRSLDTTDSATPPVADVAPAPPAQQAIANVSTQKIVAPAANQPANAEAMTQTTEVISLPLVTVAPAPATDTVSGTETDDDAAAQAVVTAWTNAWQSRDVAAYVAFYHADFVPPNQASRASWEKRRNQTISSQSSISITVADFRLVNNSGNQTTVQFLLTYRGDSYADRTVKQLVLQPDASGELRILQETNLQTEVFDPVLEDAASWMPDANAQATIAAATETREPTVSQLKPDDVILASGETAASSKPEGPTLDTAVTETIPLIFNLASLTPEEVGQINNFLFQWAQAWQTQDAERYLTHYHPDYKAPDLASAAEWREERRRKIATPAHISISLDELEILENNDSNILIELLMEYHADSYADRTLKRMLLTETSAGRWLITMETNLEVEKL